MSRSELGARWLDAHSDRSAALKTLPQGATLADITGDGEHRLLVCDLKLESDTRSRLKVYKGTVMSSDQALVETPSGIISFHSDLSETRVPTVAIACGIDLLIYKNNKPFFKFTVPNLPVSPLELEAWSKLKHLDYIDKDVGRLVDELNALPYSSLSPRSQKLLSLKADEYEEFIQDCRNSEIVRQSPITCVCVLQKASVSGTHAACPVIATEAGQIFYLDPLNFAVLYQASVCSSKASPCILRSEGVFDVEFRVIIATREGQVCLLRRGWLEGRVILQTTQTIVDVQIIPGDNFIALATTDMTLTCYSKKGTKLWSVGTKTAISCMCIIPLKHLSSSLLAVGLRGGSIQLFKGRHVVDHLCVPDTPSTLLFGRMGQEEHVLVIITINGVLELKILKRTADFNLHKPDLHQPLVQNKPLPLPKRSKLFLEQNARERQNAVEIHRNFQQDLIRLRLTAARAMVLTLDDQTGLGNEKELVKLSAHVLGLGPQFTLILHIQNMNIEKCLMDLSIVFHCRPEQYKLAKYVYKLPLIPPGLVFKLENRLEEMILNDIDLNSPEVPENPIEQSLSQQNIKIFCIRKDNEIPVIAATINMPPTDLTVPVL